MATQCILLLLLGQLHVHVGKGEFSMEIRIKGTNHSRDHNYFGLVV